MSKLSPAADRNKQPILEVLRRVLPRRGTVLEVASGTGQHVAHFGGAPSNEAFDASLRAHDPRWGLRELEALAEAAGRDGYRLDEVLEMPANNLSLVFRPL